VAESFFATVKVELAQETWTTRAHARGEVFEHIERFYNGQPHSALGYQSPVTVERQWLREHGTTAMARDVAIAGWYPQGFDLAQALRTLLFVNAWHPEGPTLRSRAAAGNR